AVPKWALSVIPFARMRVGGLRELESISYPELLKMIDLKRVSPKKSSVFLAWRAPAGKTSLSPASGATLPIQLLASLHRLSSPWPLQMRAVGTTRSSRASTWGRKLLPLADLADRRRFVFCMI